MTTQIMNDCKVLNFKAFAETAAKKIIEIWNPTGQALAAEFWVAKKKDADGKQRSGFSPVCRLKFDKRAGCQLGKGGKCSDCEIRENLPLSAPMVFEHVLGKKPNHRRGIYPMLPGDLTAWVAGDLDNHDGTKDLAEDVGRLIPVCNALDVPITIFNSNSSAGFHVYIFFSSPILAFKARGLLLALLDRAGVDISHRRDKAGSFDCIFPKQDSLKNKDIGNLIALPFSGEAMRLRRATVYLEPGSLQPAGSNPAENFETFVENLTRISEADVDGLLAEMGVDARKSTVNAGHSKGRTPQMDLPQIIEKCAFLRHCRDDARTLAEPDWYLAVCILAREYGGPALVHEISKDYHGYSVDECQAKINHALLDQPGPITCKTVKGIWDCGRDCGVTCPIQLVNPYSKAAQDLSTEELQTALDELLKKAETGDPEAAFDAVPYLAKLPKRDDMRWRQRFKTALGGKLNLNFLGEAIKEERRGGQGRKRDDYDFSRAKGPIIQIDTGQLWEVTDQALQAIEKANDPPFVFVRSGSLIRIKQNENGQTVIDTIKEAALRGILARAAHWVSDGKEGPVDEDPPLNTVRDILNLPEWRLPPLEAIVEVPVLRSDGSILVQPGYDHLSRLIYAPAPGLTIPEMPERPTQQEAKVAASFITHELLDDFPFENEACKANALALLITPIVRPAVAGKIPLALLDAPQPGTGKSLLTEMISTIGTGRPAAMMNAPKDPEEWRKQITAMLTTGTTMIVVDNVEGVLNAAPLAMALTVDTWSDRILGKSEQTNLPQRATWLATGNNIRLGGDMARRCYWIRLDAKMARPWQRCGFKHPDLLAWVSEHRGELLAALLIMARAWFLAGKPRPEGVPYIGSFSEWVGMVGGILSFVGVDCFLGNLEQMYDLTDEEGRQWEAFLEAWHDRYRDTQITVSDLTKALQTSDGFKDTLPDGLAEALEKSEGSFKKKLGRALARRTGVHFANGLRLERDGQETHKNVVQWKVALVANSETRKHQAIDNTPNNKCSAGLRVPFTPKCTSNTIPPLESKGMCILKREIGETEPANPQDTDSSGDYSSKTKDLPLRVSFPLQTVEVRCRDCQHFIPHSKFPKDRPGQCKGTPSNGFQQQWPYVLQECAGFQAKSIMAVL